jgi:FkbM family methyltransferase
MNVWGAQVRPPSVDRAVAAWLLNAGLMGRAERRFFERVVKPGQIVVDVGANQGIYTLLLSRLVGPEGRVFAFEPAPAIFAALDENCRVNHADNVTRLAAAVGEVRSRAVLRLSRFNQGDNRLTESARGPSVPVDVIPLDEVLPAERVSLVKIDVQGRELGVVRGMQAILERSPEISVFFEYWPAGLGHAGCAPGELLDFFLHRRFALFELSRSGRRRLDGRDLARSTGVGDWSWRNLLAVRE